MKDIVIAGYARSPFQPATRGALAKVRPDELAAQVVAALIERTGVDPATIEDVIVGCAFPEGEQGLNVARLIGFLAHLPESAAATTVNRFCGSSMQAIHMAAGAIAMNAGEAFVCAGVESMTRVPIMGFNPMPNPRLAKEYPEAYVSMGETAENLARLHQIPRAAQEAFAVRSHRKAAAAEAEGRLAAELVPIATKAGTVERDGGIRPDTTAEQLAGLKPAFDAQGTVTAGTSSPLTDGAAAVLVTSGDFARAHGLPVLARIRSIAVAGCAPGLMGLGPVPATQKALERAGLTLADIDVIELNEAFAAQALAVVQRLGIDEAKLNLDGGALALGHPLGASGARITGKAASLLKREGKDLALATMCIGGGQGIATVLEAA
ncbi:thiolase family protein [Benzoatithermus flavus]|uniref:acetyl-CoA C-acyltransferase n=1 Tax=Benzoatithermus flavus TaxID=3108223 RepID=A0ABU8XYF6_9PROT